MSLTEYWLTINTEPRDKQAEFVSNSINILWQEYVTKIQNKF